MIYRWLGLWAVRRAVTILFDDTRPLAEKLTREAKRILVIALVTLVVIVALVIAGVIALVSFLT